MAGFSRISKNGWLFALLAAALGFMLWRTLLNKSFEPQALQHQPDFLNFAELEKFAQNSHPGWFLENKLERFWRTPLISNGTFGKEPHERHPDDPRLGRFLRVVTWNIEKSLEMENAITAFTDEKKF